MSPGRKSRNSTSQRSLVLNASGEALHITDAQRALVLVLKERADVVAETDILVHSQRETFALPSIVQLRKYVNAPRSGRSIPITRRTVVARDGGKCAYCLTDVGRDGTMDHVIPRAQGGPHTWENVVCSCRPCNHAKRDRRPEEAGMPLLFQPSRPVGAYARLLLYSVDPAWRPYLLKE